jgi:uracil phosphoribosyltransferase
MLQQFRRIPRVLRRISAVLAVEVSRDIELEEIEINTRLKNNGTPTKQKIVLSGFKGDSMAEGFVDMIPDTSRTSELKGTRKHAANRYY